MTRKTITIPNPPVSADLSINVPLPITAVPGIPAWFYGQAVAVAGVANTLITISGVAAPAVRNIVFGKVVCSVDGEFTLTKNGDIIDSDIIGPSQLKATSDLQAPVPILLADIVRVIFTPAAWVPPSTTIRAYLVVGDTTGA